MAISVLSTSTVAGTPASSKVITKPASVAVGDLLVISASFHWNPSAPDTWPTCTGFTRRAERGVGSAGINPHAGLAILTKVADSGDVSASDYTVSGAGVGIRTITMYRVAWNGSTVDPVFNYGVSSGTLKRPSASALMLMSVATNDSATPGTDISAYSVTSGESNPSWTEVQDVQTSDTSGTYDESRGAHAYATTSNASDVTAWSYTITGSPAISCAILAIIAEPQNATTDVSHLAITPTLNGVEAAVTVTADISHQAITPTLNGVEAKVSSDNTRWQAETKPTTNWNKEI